MVFITILYDLGLEMSSETRVKLRWSMAMDLELGSIQFKVY
jgi:hypothetical protein